MDGLRIVKRFKVSGANAKEPYVTELEVTFTNTGATTTPAAA